MSGSQYIDYPLVADARDLMQRAFDYMANKFPGWEPSEGQLDTAILEATSSEAADIASLTTGVPKSIYRYFGATMMGIIPLDAVAATCTATFYAVDTNGYIIPDGTQVSILDQSGNAVPFVTLGDAQIPAGASQTSTGGVTLVAVVPGADSSGIGSVGGVVNLLDILAWIDHVTQYTVTIGGQDAESDDAYLNRLTIQLQLAANRPILPRDFGLMASNVSGVQRAVCVDGYNTADSTYNNQRMVTMAAVDSLGNAVNSTVRGNMQTYLDGMREINFVVNATDPTYTNVDVTTNVLVAPGFSGTDVQFRVQQAIQNFLSPATWGIDPSDDPNDPVTWNNLPSIKYLDVAAAIGAVPGVAYPISVATGLAGGAQSTTDKTLTGVAPLPRPGTIVVNYSLS